jgi:hypothetical protein
MFRPSLPRKRKCVCGDIHITATRGDSTHRLYDRWSGLMTRCYNKKSTNYKDYGGRGISVAPEWHLFSGFILDMEPSYMDGLTVERRDNNKGYSKSNCIWIPFNQQAMNRRSQKVITYKREALTITEWSRKVGISTQALSYRLKSGWGVDKALETSIMGK